MKTSRSTLRLVGWMLGGCALPLAVLHAGRLRPPSLPEFQTLQPRFVDVPHSLDWSRDGSLIAAAGPVVGYGSARAMALRLWRRKAVGSRSSSWCARSRCRRTRM
jgi:hypothetical protein